MATTVDVPQRGKKWRTGTLLRDGRELYRVVGKPLHYHEDCLPLQKVSRVRKPPESWTQAVRLLEIMDQVKQHGTHAPHSRGASDDRTVALIPPAAVESSRWQARQEAHSYASYPSLEVRSDDVLVYCEPIYDDSPIVTWLQDPELASEARVCMVADPRLTAYPRVRVRRS